MSLAMRPPEWMQSALCAQADPELWFPDCGGRPVDQGSPQAKAICNTCPVQTDCLEYALATGQWGIWGGTSAEQRRQMLRARNRNAA